MREIKYIGVHHSLSGFGDGRTIIRWHTQPEPKGGRGWTFPGYQAVICNGYRTSAEMIAGKYDAALDGHMDTLLSDMLASNGCKNCNAHSLHVCMIGNFDEERPTEKQMKKLIEELAYWCGKYQLDPLKAILGHHEMQVLIGEKHTKTCPGRNVNMSVIRNAVAERMKV